MERGGEKAKRKGVRNASGAEDGKDTWLLLKEAASMMEARKLPSSPGDTGVEGEVWLSKLFFLSFWDWGGSVQIHRKF